jgi:hypothetical protein
MVRGEKLIKHILSGRSDASIRFQDLRNLLIQLGFEERTILLGHEIGGEI